MCRGNQPGGRRVSGSARRAGGGRGSGLVAAVRSRRIAVVRLAAGVLRRRTFDPGAIGQAERTVDDRRQQSARTLQQAEKAQAKADKKRIRQLEQELRRKDKALAEAAALLILQKKLDAYWSNVDEDN